MCLCVPGLRNLSVFERRLAHDTKPVERARCMMVVRQQQ